MSITAISSSNVIPTASQIVKTVFDRLDKNKDGQISSAEFGAILSALKNGSAPGTDSLTASDPQVAVDAPDIPPSSWTDDNAPHGITFAGFSPQNHTDLTPDDLKVAGKAEKYAVYGYLLSNQIQPTASWAPAAADALNKKYDTTVYNAIDGETLGYGNEYVHSADNGYGMAKGTYNAKATGEFFWGWV
jgi:hypothetical protein